MKINKTRIIDLVEVIGIRWLSLAVNVLIALVVVAGIAATLGIVCIKGVLDNNILEVSRIYWGFHEGLKGLGVLKLLLSRDAFNIIRRGRGEGDKDKE